MRIILYTGKGGVGKSSMSAATACRIAASGKKVLLMSTDQAHSLRDSFEMKLGNEVTRVTENLDALEIDTVTESENAWGTIQKYLKQLLASRNGESIEVEELLVFPGLEELFSLLRIQDIYSEGRYDVLLVDCAPSGETFALLKFPEMLGQFIKKVLPVERKLVKALGPAVEKVTKIPMPEDNVYTAVESLMERLERLQKLMLNKDIVSIRLVTTPERVVIKETKRNFTCLQMYEYNVDAVIVNKVYPQEAMEGYFGAWGKLQDTGLTELKESFRDIPMFYKELDRCELKSLPLLTKAAGLYGEINPEEVLHVTKHFQLEREGDNYQLSIELPFAEREELELGQSGEDIIITIKNERRIYTLPDVVKGREIERAKLEDGRLRVQFS
ncbi:MAG: ArsA family ATPase [Lachnospiraceae bacterium]